MQTVLLVDDEEAVRQVVSKMLTRLGYAVLVAAGGREAVEMFIEHADEIGCIIIDLAMPKLDGQQTSAMLREIRSETCILLASGSDEEDVAKRFDGQGFAGFIHKPFSVDDLEQKLNEVLRPEPAEEKM